MNFNLNLVLISLNNMRFVRQMNVKGVAACLSLWGLSVFLDTFYQVGLCILPPNQPQLEPLAV